MAGKNQSEVDQLAKSALSLASDANRECAAIRVMVGESKRDGLVEARQDAESIAGRLEGRVRWDDNVSTLLERNRHLLSSGARTSRELIWQA